MTLFDLFNKASLSLYEGLKGPATSLCALETLENEETLAASDGSLISAVKIEGTLERMTAAGFQKIVSLLAEKTRLFLEKPGQSLKMVFEYDPAKAGDILADCFKPARETARACRLELGSVLDSWEKTLASQAGGENLWLVLWTKSDILEAGARKKSQKNHFNALGAVLGWPGQKEGIGLPELRQAHRGTITALREALTDSGLLNRTLPARELLRDIRSALFPDLTPPVWEAWLPGDRRPFILPETNEKLETLLTFPRLSEQLFPHQAVIWKRDFVILGDRLHAPFFLAVPPREPKPFNELFRSLSRHRYPWRLACDLSSGDPGQWSLDSLLARIFGLTSVKNRLLQGALENLKALRNQGAALVGVSFCLDTWVEILRYPSLAAAENALRRQLAELERLLSGWGQTTLQLVTGDPLLGVCGALPGLIRKTPAPRALAPLEEAFSFLPLRPASAWNRGPLVFLSPDGKPLPFWPNSSAQAAWIDLGVAPMGSGKSVLLNTLNLAFCLQPGLDELPLLSVIDVGPSSMGLIALLKNALPPHLKPQAAGCRLRPTPEYSINPLDTPLGLRSPLPGHLGFLINLLCLLATPLGQSAPPDGTAGIVRTALEAAYLEAENPGKPLDRASDPDLYLEALRHGFPADPAATWWELVDYFFDQGEIHLAHLAQRQAVPTLADAAGQIRRHTGLKATYGFKVASTAENILDYVWRSLTEALGEYRILSRPTRFSPGEARILALDLDEVAPRGGGPAGDKRAAVMYMLARQTAGARFFLMPADVPLMPEKYRRFHWEKIQNLRQTPKRLCYDEIHRLTGLKAASSQLVGDLTTSARESRKWNLSIGLYSQAPEDFPPIFAELATAVFILGAGTNKALESLARTFGLNETVQLGLSRLGPPQAGGSSLAALFKTKSGQTQDLLRLTLPPELRWAFSTTTEDAALRDELYPLFGVDRTLSYLSQRYPGGLKAILEEKALLEDRTEDQGSLLRQIVSQTKAEMHREF